MVVPKYFDLFPCQFFITLKDSLKIHCVFMVEFSDYDIKAGIFYKNTDT